MRPMDGFQELLTTAHRRSDGTGDDESRRDEFDLALAAGDWADAHGWTETLGVIRGPGVSISGGDGQLHIAYADGRTEVYPTRTVGQTISHLIGAGLLPDVFSVSAHRALLSLARVHESAADHLADSEPGARGEAVRTWRQAAESARSFLTLQRQRLLELAQPLERA